ncbi:hypothetical protein [Desulfosporosinus sp. Sb-LF]|nr:hypothetical protein [Desulfosporosinus sp. Sb-LF]
MSKNGRDFVSNTEPSFTNATIYLPLKHPIEPQADFGEANIIEKG